jgi:hypothetical protein
MQDLYEGGDRSGVRQRTICVFVFAMERNRVEWSVCYIPLYPYCIVLYCTVPYRAVRYYTVLNYNVLYLGLQGVSTDFASFRYKVCPDPSRPHSLPRVHDNGSTPNETP